MIRHNETLMRGSRGCETGSKKNPKQNCLLKPQLLNLTSSSFYWPNPTNINHAVTSLVYCGCICVMFFSGHKYPHYCLSLHLFRFLGTVSGVQRAGHQKALHHFVRCTVCNVFPAISGSHPLPRQSARWSALRACWLKAMGTVNCSYGWIRRSLQIIKQC